METITKQELNYYAKKGWTVWKYLQYIKALKAEAQQFGMSLEDYKKCLGVYGATYKNG